MDKPPSLATEERERPHGTVAASLRGMPKPLTAITILLGAMFSTAAAQHAVYYEEYVVHEKYEYEVLGVDAAAAAMIVTGKMLDNDALALTGVITAWLGPTVVHGRHHNGSGAGRAFLLRPLGALTGVVIARLVSCSNSWCRDHRVEVGAGAGYAIMALADASTFAHHTRLVRHPVVAPQLSMTPDGDVRIGLGGTF